MLVRSSGFCFCLTTPRLLKSGRIPQIRYPIFCMTVQRKSREREYIVKKPLPEPEGNGKMDFG